MTKWFWATATLLVLPILAAEPLFADETDFDPVEDRAAVFGKANEGAGSRVKMSGLYRLAGGVDSDDFIWNDSNADLQERNFRFVFGDRLNNTYDPAIYDKYLLNVDFTPKEKFDFYTQIVVDPWSFTGTTGEQLVYNQDRSSVIRPNLKYFGAFNGVLNEIYRANTGDSVGVPLTEVQNGETTAFRSRGFFDFGTIYQFDQYDIDYDFRPIRKLWMDYTEDQWHARIFALADQSQALTTDDPLELSNHKDYWQQSPWLYQYQPVQFFNDGSIKRGYYTDALSFLARDSEGNRLVLLRGVSVEADMGSTYFASTIAAPYTPWDEKYWMPDNIPGAARIKHYVNERLMIGGVYTFRAGYIDTSLADFNQVIGVDTKIHVNENMTAKAEIASSSRDRDSRTNERLRASSDGRAYKAELESAFDHRLQGHTDFAVRYTQMDANFEPSLSRYSNTRDDHFWGKHLTFKEYTPDIEHFRLGDGVDVNRRVYHLRWKEHLFKKRFENLFDVRHVRTARENSYKENVLREEATFRATQKLTLKGMFRWQDLPKSVSGIEPFLSNFYFPSDTIDTTNLVLLNSLVTPGQDPSRFTYAGGAQYKFNKQWTAEGFLEVSNDLSDFPRGLLNDTFRDSNDVVDGLLIDHVATFLYSQGSLGGLPPYEYNTIIRERVYWRPDDRITFTFHAAQNGYKYAAGIDDNVNHQGVSAAFDVSKKLSFFCDYTHSLLMDLPRRISGGTSEFSDHHNVYVSMDWKLNAATAFRAEYGVFGLGSDTPQVTPYSTTAFSLPTIDTEHLLRVSLTGEF